MKYACSGSGNDKLLARDTYNRSLSYVPFGRVQALVQNPLPEHAVKSRVVYGKCSGSVLEGW